MFGSGEGPVFRGFVCQGWEQNIGQCFNRTLQYSPFSTSSCNWNNVIAIRCRDCKCSGCNDAKLISCVWNLNPIVCSSGDVRLVGGPDRTSGVVEVCQSNLWSLIAEPGWSDSNAAVVCKQLQFSDEGDHEYTCSCRCNNITPLFQQACQKRASWGTLGFH